MSGKFVVFEGIDGSGKSTQAARLAGALRRRGVGVYETREPTAGAVGQLVSQVLAGRYDMEPRTLALAFAADRLEHLTTGFGVAEALERGDWVVCDRYVLSSLAYQAAQGVDRDWLAQVNRMAAVPDVTVYLDVPVLVAAARLAARGKRDLFETDDTLTRVAHEYDRLLRDGTFQRLRYIADGCEPADAVAAAVERYVAERVGVPA